MASSSAEESTTRPWSQEVQPTQPIARDNRTTQSFGSNQQQQQHQQGRAQANIHVNEAEINSIVTGKDEQVKVVSSEEEEEEDHQQVHQPEILSIVRTTVEEYSPGSDTESLESVELPSRSAEEGEDKEVSASRALSPPSAPSRATSTSPLLSPPSSSPPPSSPPPLLPPLPPVPPSKTDLQSEFTKGGSSSSSSKAPPSTPILNSITTPEEFVESVQQSRRRRGQQSGSGTVPKHPPSPSPPPLPPLPPPPALPPSTSSSRKGSGAPIIRSPSSPAKYHLPKRKRHWLRGVIVLLVSLFMFLRQDWLIQSCKFTI